MNKFFKTFLLLLIGAVTTTSCGDDDDGIIFGGGGSATPASGTLSADYAKRLEVPALKSGNVFVHHSTLYGKDSVMTYCLEYDPAANHSRWVAFRFDAVTSQKNVGRIDAWADDPKLPSSMRVGAGTFWGYNRGHLCASADRMLSREANAQTFYMSNMSPQTTEFNGGIWLDLEGHIQTLARTSGFADTIYVVKGGTITTDKILGTTTSSGSKSIRVPKYYFVALLRVKNNTYNAIGFLLEHRAYSSDELNLSSYALSIDELETETGIDFFHNLPDVVENAVESTIDLASWKL